MKHEQSGSVIAVVGLGDGDEGKAKLVDVLVPDADFVVRCQGGSNAGHTTQYKGIEFDFHQIPSSAFNPNAFGVIGSGCLTDVVKLSVEKNEVLEITGIVMSPASLAISHEAHLVLPIHKELDSAREKDARGAQGSTRAGIAYAASDKALREGVRVEEIMTATRSDLFDIAYERREILAKRYGLSRDRASRKIASDEAIIFADEALKFKPYICDTVDMLHSQLQKGARVLLEGAQAYGLDLDHGKYPFVTSSNPTLAGLLQGSGISHNYVREVYGVAKMVPTKVGGGVFVSGMDEEIARSIRGNKGEIDAEYGKTTGRPRELGYFDLPKLRRAVEVNGVTKLALSKSDWIARMGDTTKVVVAYEYTDVQGRTSILKKAPSGNKELWQCVPIYEEFKTWTDPTSRRAKKYYKFVENFLGVPVTFVGTGPGRDDMIRRHKKGK